MACEYTYQPIDETVWLNTDDANLWPIPINQLDLLRRTYRQYGLTEPEGWPEMERIDGYGKRPSDQYFERETIPPALVELESSIRYELRPVGKSSDLTPVRRELTLINKFWDTLNANQEKYKDEIEWIRRMWYYRLVGKFFFCNGKVTYIPGFYWFFLNFYVLNSGSLPQYRDRDRRWSLAFKWAEVCTTTFSNINKETGTPIPESDGTYAMTDTGNRVFFGCVFPKARRVGDSSRLECYLLEFATRKLGGKCGIQAKDDATAETIFSEHLIQPYLKIPLFFKPLFDTSAGLVPKNGISFDDYNNPTNGLHSIVDVATSSDAKKFDGKYLDIYHGDEFGKLQREDCNEVVGIIKYCASTGGGSKIHGIMGITSTTDEVSDKSAGENFMRLCNRSMYEQRNDNGQTSSGLFTVFFRAEDGLEGYVGPYGESIIENPTPDQIRFIGKKIGARQFIDNNIAALRRSKDFHGLAMFRRQHPQSYNDCFIPPPSAQVLPRELIETQISFLQQNPQLQAVRGDLFWKAGLDSEVVWIPNAENGRFYLSRRFAPSETNRKVYRDNMWWPLHQDKFLASADTFGVDQTIGRKSNGSILIRWRHDITVDPPGKEMELWESGRDILTYSHRPSTVGEYVEDVIMAIVYTGAKLYPERNKENLLDGVIRRGYGGYLLYDHDRNTGKPKPTAGFWNKNELMDAAIRWLDEDLKKNYKRYYHLELLKELLDFGGRQYLTNLDLTVSKLGTLIGEKNAYYDLVKSFDKTWDCSGWIPGCKI